MNRTTQSAMVVSIPALAVALLLGLLMVTAPFTSRPLHAQATASQSGQLRLVSNAIGHTGDFVLELEQMAPAPAGEHYELWMQSDTDELLRLGEFAVIEGSVTFAGSTSEDLLGGYNTALISLEPDDDTDETVPAQVVLSSTLSSQLLDLTRQLLVSTDDDTPILFDSLQAQIAIAAEENRLLADALAVDDFSEVRRRAEHIVNILSGETGAFYGDHDRDGQIQNPGDGVGVRGYLEQVNTILSDIATVEGTDGELNAQAQQVTTQIEESQLLVERAREQAQKVFAADTKAESEAIAAELDILFAELTDALADTYSMALGLATYRFGSPSAIAADGEQAGGARIGQLQLTRNEISRTSSFTLELVQIAPATSGTHYELWMQAETGLLLRLGEFAVDENDSVTFTGSTPENLLAEYNTALISLEPDDDPDESALTQVVLSSTLPSQLLDPARQLLTGSTAGNPSTFGNLQAQIAIFSQHSGFLVDALILNDEAEVRRHAEHIVNILDGESGAFFGDLDRDGQTQNPGDGVGVRVYLDQARDITLDIHAVVSNTQELDAKAQEIVAMFDESQLLVDQSRERAISVFGITNELDLLEAARDLVQTAARLTSTAQRARDVALSLVVYEFVTPSGSATATFSETLSPITSTAVIVSPPATATAGETWTHPLERVLYVYVPGGEVTLGATTDDLTRAIENPEHTVEVAAFWMRQTEVTNEQYGQCVAQGVCTPPNNNFWQEATLAEHPVTHVSWDQANAYARWVGGKLPSEAEWEFACQGSTEQEYPWGDTEPTAEMGNYAGDVGGTAAVGSYPEGTSPLGLLDMSGNVWEWTSSLDQLYPYDAEDGREDLAASGNRIGRGGSFGYAEQSLRCAARMGFHPAWQIPHVGFRVIVPAAE